MRCWAIPPCAERGCHLVPNTFLLITSYCVVAQKENKDALLSCNKKYSDLYSNWLLFYPKNFLSLRLDCFKKQMPSETVHTQPIAS